MTPAQGRAVRAQRSPLYSALTSGQRDPIRGETPNPDEDSLRLDGSENRVLGVGGDSRARTLQPAQDSRGTLWQPRRLRRPPGTPPSPRAHPRSHGGRGSRWPTSKRGEPLPGARASPRPLTHSMLSLQLGQPLLPQRLEFFVRHGAAVPSCAGAAAVGGSRSRTRPPVHSVGIASARDSSTAPFTAQTRVMLRHQESSPELGGCPASARVPCRGPILR